LGFGAAFHHEAATDREVPAFGQHGSIAIEGLEQHRIGMLRQRLLAEEDDVARPLE